MFNPKLSVLDLTVPSPPQKLCLQTSASVRQQVVGMEGVRQEETMEIYTRLYIKDLILSGTFLRVSLNLNRCRRKTAGAGELTVTVSNAGVEKGRGGRGGVQERTELCGQKGIIHHVMKSAVSDRRQRNNKEIYNSTRERLMAGLPRNPPRPPRLASRIAPEHSGNANVIDLLPLQNNRAVL